MTHDEKKQYADKYIGNLAGGLGWDDLSDTNSLHDCETIQDIEDACRERLEKGGFPFDDDKDE